MQSSLSARWSCLIAVGLIALPLLFTNLGRQPLWDDEANTALFAESVWATGDMDARVGDNVVAYRNGAELENLENRYLPPLPYFVAAPFVGVLGPSAWSARLPFALAGACLVLLLLHWLRRSEASLPMCACFGIALLLNVSFFLYARQARYYALAMLFATSAAYSYVQWSRSRPRRVGLAGSLIALFATNYIVYAAVAAALVLDYLVWRRRDRLLSRSDLLWLCLPQLVVCGIVGWVWNPLDNPAIDYRPDSASWDKVSLLLWTLRDLDEAECCLAVLLLAAPLIGIIGKRPNLLRGTGALAVAIVVTTLASPQAVGAGPPRADVRYLAPIIPLCLYLGAATLTFLLRARLLAIAVVAPAVFGTNLLHRNGALRSTALEYWHELAAPPPSSYEAAARWVRDNVEPGQTVVVWPDFRTYPLMFHAPQAVYGWQLHDPPDAQFEALPDVHVRGRTRPDFLIVFGPMIREIERDLRAWRDRGWHFEVRTALHAYYREPNRPELFLHRFRPIDDYDPLTEMVYVLAATAAAPTSDAPASLDAQVRAAVQRK